MKRFRHAAGPWLVVIAIGLLSAGTISNQIRINAASTQLRAQALNGQRSLTRTCQLLPISLKVYTDVLRRHVISDADFLLVADTARRICPR